MIGAPRILRRPDYARVPWKNGAGHSLEIAVQGPAGEPFDWRLSIATISEDGAFSNYDGYDRHTVLLAGAGFDLTAEGAAALAFARTGGMHAYSGATRYYCRLRGGACQDLNLIARRGLGASLEVIEWRPGAAAVGDDRLATAVLPLDAPARLVVAGAGHELGAWDTAFLPPGERATVSFDASPGRHLLVVARLPAPETAT